MKNKIYGVILVLMLLLTTGCGTNDYIKDSKGNIVINEATGQNLQKNIFCKPSKGTKAYELYEEYSDQMGIKLSKLPECSNFKLTSNKTKSLWEFIFVKPLAWVILKIGYIFKDWGLTKAYLGVSLMLVGILIRLLILPLNLKNQKQSREMQKVKAEMDKLELKYKGKTDQESTMRKAQEMQGIYKKYNVSPFSSCLIALIQLPVFFAFLQAIYKIPAIYEGKIFGWNLGTTPKVGIFTDHNYTFIILVVLIALTTYFSFKYTMKQSGQQLGGSEGENQMSSMVIIMTVMITITSFTLPTAIALYWIVTYAFMIIQTYLTTTIQKSSTKKQIENKRGSIKKKLKMKEGMKYGKNN